VQLGDIGLLKTSGCVAALVSPYCSNGEMERCVDNSSQPTPRWRWIELIATKYFSVWIWSVVIGITTGVSFSLVNFFPRARGSFLVLLLAPLQILSAICVLVSWFALLRFLDGYIIPIFFGEEGGYRVAPNPERFLSSAVRYSLGALAFRLLLSLADLLLSSTSGF
jgi:hypothetical protein